MVMEIIGPSIDRAAVDNINKNFKNLDSEQATQVQNILSGKVSETVPGINGMLKAYGTAWNTSQDYGVNFMVKEGGVLRSTWVFANASGNLEVGYAEQGDRDLAGSVLGLKTVSIEQGWNRVILDFPVEANKQYTLFKRGRAVDLRHLSVQNWSEVSTWNTPNRELEMKNGRNLFNTGNSATYFFFELAMITNVAQAYRVMAESTIPEPQFYVGDTPPKTAQFWFKPVGG